MRAKTPRTTSSTEGLNFGFGKTQKQGLPSSHYGVLKCYKNRTTEIMVLLFFDNDNFIDLQGVQDGWDPFQNLIMERLGTFGYIQRIHS